MKNPSAYDLYVYTTAAALAHISGLTGPDAISTLLREQADALGVSLDPLKVSSVELAINVAPPFTTLEGDGRGLHYDESVYEAIKDCLRDIYEDLYQ